MTAPAITTRAGGGTAVVIGGSVGGLFLGNMLHRRGWKVDIVEKVGEDLASRGAGIARHLAMNPALSASGISHDERPGIPVEGRTAYDRSGRVVARYRYPQHLTAWAGMYNRLHDAFPSDHYHLGRELVGIEGSVDRPQARFADGSVLEADLIVGADGFRSTVRGIAAPDVEPLYSGYVAWRGVMDESELSPEFRAETFGNFSFCFAPGSQFIGYPLIGRDGSVEPGRRRYSFLWYYHVDGGADLSDLLTDDGGRTHAYSIPPPLIRSEHVTRMNQAAEDDLPPQFAEVVTRASSRLVQPIYDVESERLTFGRVALLGDAAFVARPHVGIGVLKAGQDALALADCLARTESIPEALADYDRERVPAGRDAVEFGRHLGYFIEHGLAGPTSDPDLNLRPETIIEVSARPIPEIESYWTRAMRQRSPATIARMAQPARMVQPA